MPPAAADVRAARRETDEVRDAAEAAQAKAERRMGEAEEEAQRVTELLAKAKARLEEVRGACGV